MESTWSEVDVIPFTKKCLTNKKVCHDVTGKDYPNFNVFQDIQSQNNFITTQLNVMGYKGDALKSQFMDKKFRRSRPPQLSQYPRRASAKRLLPPQIHAAR